MEEGFNISDNFKYRIAIIFLIIIIVYINIYNCLLYRSNNDIQVISHNYSEELGKEELLKIQRDDIVKEIYEEISDKNILVEELNKKADGNMDFTIVISETESNQTLLLKELSEIPFLEIQNIGISYNSDNNSKLRAKFELR